MREYGWVTLDTASKRSVDNKQIRIVRDKANNKHRGYAFIVYEREKDMKGTVTLITFLPFTHALMVESWIKS